MITIKMTVIFSALSWIFIIFHEMAHYVVAEIVGIPIKTISIGTGKRIFSFKIKNTKIKIGILPGGNVMPELENYLDFYDIPLKSRVLYLSGGILVNASFAIIMLILGVFCLNIDLSYYYEVFSNVGLLYKQGNMLHTLMIFIFYINVIGCILNLLPIIDMDGGKIIFSILEKYASNWVKGYLIVSFVFGMLLVIVVIIFIVMVFKQVFGLDVFVLFNFLG